MIGRQFLTSYAWIGVLTLAAAYGCVSRFNIRPDIFSLFFFAVFLYILRFRIDKKIIWFLLPIQTLWVNLHGYFFLGPLLVFLFILAEFLRRKIPILPWHWKNEFVITDFYYKRLKYIFLLIILACLLNPNWLEGALYPFYIFKRVLSGQDKIFFKYITELQPAFKINKFSINYYMVILPFSFMAVNFKRLKIIEIILFAFFFPFAFTLRNVPFFCFITYLIVITYVNPTLGNILRYIKIDERLRKGANVFFKYAIIVVLMPWMVTAINKELNKIYYDFDAKQMKSQLLGIDYSRFPKNAVDFILENNIPLRMLNDFNSGSYLIGRAYPKRQVFIDGRTELYGQEFFKQNQDLMDGDISVFGNIINKYNITAILLEISYDFTPNIISYIYKNPQWKLVFLDENALVFLKDIPDNQGLIKKYKIDLSKYVVPSTNLKDLKFKFVYPTPYIKRASLFYILNEDALVVAECKEALRIMSYCAEAYHFLGKVYLRKGSYQEAFENLRSADLLLPRHIETYVDLGVSLEKLKETKLAINALKGAIKLDKRYASAYYHLGCIYLTADNGVEAIKVLNKAVRYAPLNPRYYLKLAEALYKFGKESKNNSQITNAKGQLKIAAELNVRYGQDLFQEIEDLSKEVENYLSSKK
jgi:tetratricopeptide (TPR) repeat protein